jgi:hypothetical protein
MNVKVTRHETVGCSLVPQDRVQEWGGGGYAECGNEPSGFLKRWKFLNEMSGYAFVFSVQTVLEQVFTTVGSNRDSNPQSPE